MATRTRLGWIALQVAFGKSRQQADRTGALHELSSTPFGSFAMRHPGGHAARPVAAGGSGDRAHHVRPFLVLPGALAARLASPAVLFPI